MRSGDSHAASPMVMLRVFPAPKPKARQPVYPFPFQSRLARRHPPVRGWRPGGCPPWVRLCRRSQGTAAPTRGVAALCSSLECRVCNALQRKRNTIACVRLVTATNLACHPITYPISPRSSPLPLPPPPRSHPPPAQQAARTLPTAPSPPGAASQPPAMPHPRPPLKRGRRGRTRP